MLTFSLTSFLLHDEQIVLLSVYNNRVKQPTFHCTKDSKRTPSFQFWNVSFNEEDGVYSCQDDEQCGEISSLSRISESVKCLVWQIPILDTEAIHNADFKKMSFWKNSRKGENGGGADGLEGLSKLSLDPAFTSRFDTCGRSEIRGLVSESNPKTA
ncbi:hypothetical protein Tco_1569446 [Tanacetum coccineum]